MKNREMEDQVVNAMRDHFLKYTDEVVEKYKTQITNAVRWYVGGLPRHVASTETDDLTSEARLAFIESLKTWDPRKGELWTYVNIRLKGAMQDYLRRRGKDPVAGMYEWITSAAHVYLAFNKEGIQHETIEDESFQIQDALADLSETERLVLTEYYTKDRTFKEIGNEISLSESQVSRICKSATLKIKKNFKSDE